jgi:hypothetical protein
MPDFINKANFKSVVNNAALDPLQGFDADVWVVDQGTGSYNLVGRFTSIQIVIRNATEPYMEYNQRIPRQLDGDIQIGWVMERGQLDGRVLEQTFGLSSMGRELRLNRMPRFQITFQLYASELHEKEVAKGAQTGVPVTYRKRSAKNEIVLSMCKIDTFTMGSTAGRQVIANRWEGLAEGIDTFDRTSVDDGVTFNSELASKVRYINPDNSPFPWDKTLYTNANKPNFS